MDRKQALIAWTQEALNDSNSYLKSASSDASFRSYWRIFSQGKTYIVMDAPPAQENCLPFIEMAERLHHCGVQVPQIIAQNLQHGFLLLTDLGTVQYLDVLNENSVSKLYKEAISALHTIQQKASHSNLPVYDRDLLLQELSLFEQWFVQKHLGKALSNEQIEIIKTAKNTLIENALQQPQTFVHRDFHSRNLMKTKNNNPGILDFQDAVIGPVTYDLVSLLKDCYISWDTNLIKNISDEFRKKYNQLNKTDIDPQQWQKWFDLMGVQRHLKVVGIFCRLYYRDNKANYLKDLNLTLCYIKQACSKYEELIPLLNFINEVSPNMESICEP